MYCAFCSKPADRLAAWKTESGNFYCSEFCAEVESMEPTTFTSAGEQPVQTRD
jgi:hypothetical protein